MTIRDLLLAVRVADPQLSPDGKTVAFVRTTTDLAAGRRKRRHLGGSRATARGRQGAHRGREKREHAALVAERTTALAFHRDA
jgi:hypothetical protein